MASLSTLLYDDKVMIVAKDAYYAYVDGWRGRVTGSASGHVEVKGPGMLGLGCQGTADNAPEITLYVPHDQLVQTV